MPAHSPEPPAFEMPQLSSPLAEMKDHYTVVIIGSGYGGSIAASRMARAGQRVCLLERGKELHPRNFPALKAQAIDNMQADSALGRIGSRTGLYDFRINDEVNVFMGCGLGGTSLVNANVSLRADTRIFRDERWPQEVQQDAETVMPWAYERAEEALQPTPYPDERSVPKLRALELSSKEFPDGRFYRPPINVTFSKGKLNYAGLQQQACTDCGDCVSGCNVGAKNTTLMNYLPDAKRHGAKIYTETKVSHVAKADGKWRIYFEALSTGEDKFDSPERFVSADIVILGCGTLGSTEILLRSREKGLSLSAQLGEHFSGNGDVLGFAYNTDVEINGMGFGRRTDLPRVGPCITGIIDLRDPEKPVEEGLVIEEGSIPGALAEISSRTMPLLSVFHGQQMKRTWGEFFRQARRAVTSFFGGPYTGASRNTQTYLIMSQDDGRGRMVLENDRLRIKWPGAGSEKNFTSDDEALVKATKPLGGVYVKDPLWTSDFKWELVTVHPLGGCVMASDAARGVIDHKGRAFSGLAGTSVHEGLYVCDGSVVPVTLGVNPLLTISALAERCCHYLAQDHGWKIDYTPNGPWGAPAAEKVVGLGFTETMRGFFVRDAAVEFAALENGADLTRHEFQFTLSIHSDHLDAMLSQPDHRATISGTATSAELAAAPMTVNTGEFNLFVRDPSTPETYKMRYRFIMTDTAGRHYFLEGFKTVRNEPIYDVWHDTSTLYFTLYDGADATATALGRGILHIEPLDFLTQMRTLRVTNVDSKVGELEAIARFGKYFAGVLWHSYGGICAGPYGFNTQAPPRVKRALRAGPPMVFPFVTEDNVALRLTRFQGGKKGPVILVHGLGVSSEIFSTDLIETNLVEYLAAHEYDVWLLDFRASILLEASQDPSDGDQVARYDYPAAVAKVREITGAETVQFVVHCWGASAFFMSLFSGAVSSVRSVISSQIGAYSFSPLDVELKTGLHLPDLLAAVGVHDLDAYARDNESWWEKLYDRALEIPALIAAQGRCTDATCHRITFMYASLYRHEQLNDLTHANLHELFGIANMRAFQHIAKIGRAEHSVDFADETYLTDANWARLNLPIAFIHGAENHCFLPKGTERTFDELTQRFGPAQYSRTVIPGYGHIDCIFGKDAARDVYPHILAHLEKTS